MLTELQRWYDGDHSIGLITANSYGQLRRSVLQEVFNMMSKWGIEFNYNQQQSLLTLNGAKKFFCVSVDQGSIEKTRGLNCSAVWQDESCFQKDLETYNTIQGRIRVAGGSGVTLCTSSPNSFNFMYDLFQGELHNPKTHKLIRAKTKDNKYISDTFYESMRSQLDERSAKQELDGEWVSLTGTAAYYGFDRRRHVKPIKWDGTVGYIGIDHNVEFYCATIFTYVNGIFYFFDEVVLRGGSDSFMMCSELKRRGYGNFKVISDSTYSNRNLAGKSIKNIIEGSGFQTMSTRNPYVQDRVVGANRLFNTDRVFIDPSLKVLIKDFEQVKFKENGKLDGSNIELTHASDSATYGMWRLAPIEISVKKRAFSIKR